MKKRLLLLLLPLLLAAASTRPPEKRAGKDYAVFFCRCWRPRQQQTAELNTRQKNQSKLYPPVTKSQNGLPSAW